MYVTLYHISYWMGGGDQTKPSVSVFHLQRFSGRRSDPKILEFYYKKFNNDVFGSDIEKSKLVQRTSGFQGTEFYCILHF